MEKIDIYKNYKTEFRALFAMDPDKEHNLYLQFCNLKASETIIQMLMTITNDIVPTHVQNIVDAVKKKQ